MKLFLKEYTWFLLLYGCNFILLLLFFYFFDNLSQLSALWYFIFLSVFLLLVFLIFSYQKSKGLYQLLSNSQGYFQSEKLGSSPLSKALENYHTSQLQNFLALENTYKQNHSNYLMFINRWVHYIKTPISVLNLICNENEQNEMSAPVQSENEKILYAVQMALNFARITEIQNDLHFETILLQKTVTEVVHDLKRYFIRKSIFPKVEIDDSYTLQTDVKWFKFVIHQILINAIKYSDKPNTTIHIKLEENKLSIKDEGMGIPQKDQGRIFDKFFTGENGRKMGESTGIGLYMVHEICDKLRYPIHLESQENKGTTFSIILKSSKT